MPPGTDLSLQKVLWTNIADLRLAEERRKHRRSLLIRVGSVYRCRGGGAAGVVSAAHVFDLVGYAPALAKLLSALVSCDRVLHFHICGGTGTR